MQYDVLTLSEWCDTLKDFLLDDEKVTPFTEGLEYIFTNMNFYDILSYYEVNFSTNKNEFINLIIHYIDNHFIHIEKYKYNSTILKYFFEFWGNYDDLDEFNILESYLSLYQLNDFTILIDNYNKWLESKHTITILVEDYRFLLKNWIEWYDIRNKMNHVFINNNDIDWDAFHTYLNTY